LKKEIKAAGTVSWIFSFDFVWHAVDFVYLGNQHGLILQQPEHTLLLDGFASSENP
jgi:hypothetical protein